MLVSEIKNEIKDYSKKELEDIIIELYKRLPKAKKEDYNIDDFIRNVNNKGNKSIKKSLDFDSLKKEILYFLECVDLGYYTKPNKITAKKERSTWRFKVKKYYKDLNNIMPNSNNGDEATLLLIEIFKRLSKGSNILLFVNWETFNALGISQSDYYDTLMKRILYNGYSKEGLQKCIDLLDIEKDPYDYYSMFQIFTFNLKTIDMKEDAITLLKENVNYLNKKLQEEKNRNLEFYLKELLNDYVDCVTNILFSMHEIAEGIDYFHSNYISYNDEVQEYILLNKLDELNLTKEWLKEYEKNIEKIDFRNLLKKRYQELKSEKI